MKILVLIIIFPIIIIFAACTRSIPMELEPVSFPGVQVSSPDPLSTEQPDDVVQPTQKSTEKLSGTSTPNQISTSNSLNAKVAEIGFMGDDLLIITVKIHYKLDFEISAFLNNIEYTCISQEDIPDHIYCYGPRPEAELRAEFVLKRSDDETVILSEEIMIPVPVEEQIATKTDS